MDKTDAFDAAIQFAVDHETTWDRSVDGVWGVHQNDPEPWNRLLGPVHDRGPVSGAIALDGRLLASWGEPSRPDLTFSIAKTYLALLAGVAFDRGLLPDVHEPVGQRLPGIGFDEGHNRQITWHQLLQQTSEWEGTLFGVPDQADRYRHVAFGPAPEGRKGDPRPLQDPGTYWEYNDVRINQLSLALMHLFGRPLPEVFAEAIMQPIGASTHWQWRGYDNAWVEVGGRCMQSVPGGTHWGGGLSISVEDQMRIGQMMLDGGMSRGRVVISQDWLQRMLQPCDLAPFYGYLVWLNHERRIFPSLPQSSHFAIGAGSSLQWIEPQRRLLVIVRWLDSPYADAFFARVLQAVDA